MTNSYQKKKLRDRVIDSAEAVLERNGAVGPIELFEQMGFLSPVHVNQWKQGNPHCEALEAHVQCGQKKRDQTFKVFFEWVAEKKLEPIEATYSSASHSGAQSLKITVDGDAEKEAFFRTQFRPANLSDAKQQRLKKKLTKTPDLVVYQITSNSSNCSECAAEIFKGECIVLEKGKALCLTCADMDHLEFLPSGNATLTRRSKKLSPLSAIVLRFNRSRKRYERQGILVTSAAIDEAEEQCAADADQRARLRERAAERRADDDVKLIDEMAQLIQAEYPGCPASEARSIATHTAQRGSGRVGRSAAGRSLETQAITLAVAAWIRHQHTNYDELLMGGVERHEARQMIRDVQQNVIRNWTNL